MFRLDWPLMRRRMERQPVKTRRAVYFLVSRESDAGIDGS
jgi:hypothetical protein